METAAKRPIQWSICLLHLNELPLRHLLQNLDGHTKGPYSYSGPIGSLLKNCEKMPVVKFKAIITTVPELLPNDLSTDQKYLFQICGAIRNGNCSSGLAEKHPGVMSHARWLTTANRLLRLYIATENPSPNLVTLTEYIVKVYAPVWFDIKAKPLVYDGAKHLWKAISASRIFPDTVTTIIDKVFTDNGYFAHPENLLLSMLVDSRKHVRELAARRIQKARLKQPTATEEVRVFKVPSINFTAAEYTELIDWQSTTITEPPLAAALTNQELQEIIQGTFVPNFGKFPCHTQAVERCVKVVTEASLKVCDESSRDGYIRLKLKGRKLLPAFDYKSQYFEKRDEA